VTHPIHGPHHPIQLCNDVVILMQHRQTCSVRTPAAAAPAPARAPFRVVAQKKVTKKQQVSLCFWAPCSHPCSDSIQRWGSEGVFTAPTCGRKDPVDQTGWRRSQVILTQDLPGTGLKGELTSVNYGFFRNYLQPQRIAVPATAGVLEYVFHSPPALPSSGLSLLHSCFCSYQRHLLHPWRD